MRNHKNIILEKFQEKKNVIIMYDVLIHRVKDKEQVRIKIRVIKDQLNMLLTKYPEYFV